MTPGPEFLKLWRQGLVVPLEHVEKFISSGVGTFYAEATHAVVVSHDCDLTNGDLEKEPLVECLLVKDIPSLDGSCTLGKNPRVFHFMAQSVCYSAHIGHRIWVKKEAFMNLSPERAVRMEDKERKQLVRWLAKRYVRAAFPDEFNRRIAAIKGELRKALQKDGERIAGIYLNVEDAELEPGVAYDTQLWAVMGDADFSDAAKRIRAQKAIDQVAALLSRCEIDAYDVKLVSSRDFSLEHLEQLQRWDYDDLSYRTEPEGAMGPE